MTGMTDISRHGGDKKHRDGLDIQVKDDALIDPALLGEISDYPMQADNLVDDSDDDGEYEFGDSGPSMAAKVVQAGFKLFFFPLILVSKGIMSLRHIPWLCGQILYGIKNAPASLKSVGAFFKAFFSPNSRLGKVLIVIGTLTGVIWLSRRIRTSGFRLQASDSASNVNTEVQTLKPEASSEVRSPKPEASTESRRKIGFGQLSKIASVFKRSEPVTSPDAASPNSEDRYDSFETSGNRWGAKKSMFFAALCLVLLVGGVAVARQVMQKNSDVAQQPADDEMESDVGTQEPEQKDQTQTFGGFQSSPNANIPVSSDLSFPPVPNFDSGISGNGMGGQPNNDMMPPWLQEPPSTPAMQAGATGNTMQLSFPEIPMFNNQGGTIPVTVLDAPDEPVSTNPLSSSIATQTPSQPGVGSGLDDSNAGYDSTTATMQEYAQPSANQFAGMGLLPPVAPVQGYSGNFNDSPSAFDAMPVVQPQPAWVAPPAEPSLLTLTPTPQIQPVQPVPVQQDRSVSTSQHDDTPSLASVYGTSPNNAPTNLVSSDTGLSRMAVTSQTTNTMLSDLTTASSAIPSTRGASSGIMSLTPMNSSTGSGAIINDVNEQDTWVAAPPEQPLTQRNSDFALAQNEPPMQATQQIMGLQNMETPATSPRETSPNLVTWSPQPQSPAPTTPSILQPNPAQQPVAVLDPVTFPGVADNNSFVSGGIVSPSQHIAAMPMVSPDTQTSLISHEMPPTGISATSAPAYSMQSTSFQNVAQQPIPQASVAQFASNGQNSVYVVQSGDSIYKIAKQELGSVRRYREIYELNRDRLPLNQDTLTAGLELLLPTGR